MRRTRSEIGDAHGRSIDVGRPRQRHHLPCSVRAEFRRIDTVEKTGSVRMFADVQEVLHGVGVVMIAEIIEILDVRVIRVGGVGVAAAQFVSADVVDGFLGGAVLVDLPGKELVKRVPAQAGAGQQIRADATRLWKYFRLIGCRR